jgi:hypothetical protein
LLRSRRSSATSPNTLIIDKISQLFDLKRTELSKLLYGKSRYLDKILIRDLDTIDLNNKHRPRNARLINDVLELMYKINQLDAKYDASKEDALEFCKQILFEVGLLNKKSLEKFDLYYKLAFLVSKANNEFVNFLNLNREILEGKANDDNRIEWILMDQNRELPSFPAYYLKIKDLVTQCINKDNDLALDALEIVKQLDDYNLGHLPITIIKRINPSEIKGIELVYPGGFDPNQYPIYLTIGQHDKILGTGDGKIHIWEGHQQDFKDLGKWLGVDLSMDYKIVDFIEETIKTKKGLAKSSYGNVIFAFQNDDGEFRFLELYIDFTEGKFKQYFGRIHTAYSVAPSSTNPAYRQKYNNYIQDYFGGKTPKYGHLINHI